MLVAVAIILGFLGYGPAWTGFGGRTVPVGRGEAVFPAKTLWDWMQLLVVPLALAAGAYWLNRVQSERERRAQETQRERELRIEDNRSQDAALEAYLDRMDQLLLDRGLRESQEGDEVRVSARARTITVLSRLDSRRKASVLRFLYEARLIAKGNPVVDLDGADLRHTDLYGFKLIDADLSGADLSDANLTLADLSGAELTFTKFIRANLKQARLKGAHMPATTLRRAILHRALLDAAVLTNSVLPRADLSGALMDDAVLKHAKLDRCDMRGASARRADFSGARLFSADLTEANLSDANLEKARFEVRRTDRINMEVDDEAMRRMSLAEEDNIQEDLESATLTRTVLDGASLWSARISDMQISSCASREGAELPAHSTLHGPPV
jgi:uncharacterized protein YjbI with pentapeptide repeats